MSGDISRQPDDDETQPDDKAHTPRRPIRSVAVVEDQDANRDLLVSLLRLNGYRVESAADGNEGLALIERMQPDVAIIDVGLPERDGYAIASAIRKRMPDRPITLIALTGFGQPADIDKAIAAGFDHHLMKPLQLRLLHEMLGPPGNADPMNR